MRVYCLILFLALFLLLLLILISLDLPAQNRLSQSTIQHEVTVTLKLVQVYVTDKQGNPVIDLRKEDFIIYDNGKKQIITDFERHLHSFILEKLKNKEILAETAVPEPRQLMNRKFFLLFDFVHNNPKGVRAAKKAALHFFEKIVHPADEIGILTYSTLKGMKLHEFLSTDHQRVRHFVESIGIKDALSSIENFEAEYWQQIAGINPVDASKAGGVDRKEKDRILGLPGISSESTRFFKTGENRIQALRFLERMTELAKSLRYIPGIKYILLFSSGIPYSLVYGIQSPWGKDFGAWADPILQEKVQVMERELNHANTVIFAFDTEDSLNRINMDSRVIGGFTLEKMASTTGGKYFGNINRYEEALEQVERLTGCYYVLGYYVDERWDGKYHEIKVEVKRPDVKVYAQRGYFNPKPFKEWTDLERMLHLVDLALSERPLFQAPLPLRCGGFSYFDGGKENLVLWAELVREELLGLAGGEVEVVYLVFDKEGNMVKMGRQAKAFDKLSAEAIYFSSPFALQPGEYKLRVVVRSLETGRGAVGGGEVILSGAKASGLSLSQPLLLQKGEGRRYENMPSFLFPFDLKSFIPLSWQLKEGEREFYVLFSCGYSGLKEPEIRIYGQLLKVEGERTRSVPLNLILLRRDQGEGKGDYLIKIETQPLEPGSYYLYFHSEEKGTFSRASTHLALIIKD